jgi:hypothetical protein
MMDIAPLEKEVIRLQKMLSKATRFTFSGGRLPITVEMRGDNRWAVCDSGFCLNRDGEFEAEPLNSSRSREFLERTRYTFDEAWELAEKTVKELSS